MSIDRHVQELGHAASGLILLAVFCVLFWVAVGAAVLVWLYH